MKNTLLILGGAVAAYYLYKKSQTPTQAEVSTRPMIIADPMESDVTARPIEASPINLPNFGIPYKNRPDMTYSNIDGKGRRRKYDKAEDKILAYCRRHPQSPQCIGLDWGQ